jgi:dienelactone hydrolase
MSAQIACSQNKIIDDRAFAGWKTIGGESISSDGKYVSYIIENRSSNDKVLVLKSTNTKWKLEVNAAGFASFSQNSKKAVFMKSKDSMGIVTLGTSSIEYKTGVVFFGYTFSKNVNKEWLAYRKTENPKALFLLDLVTGKQIKFDSVAYYLFNEQGSALVFQQQTAEPNDKVIQALNWMNLKNESVKRIWSGESIASITFDNAGSKIAFLEPIGKDNSSLYYFCENMPQASLLIDHSSKNILRDFSISNSRLSFSPDGGLIFFGLERSLPESPSKNSNLVGVDVWNYKDKYLQYDQLLSVQSENEVKSSFKAVVNIKSKKVVQIDDEDLNTYGGNWANNRYTICFKRESPDYYYNKESRPSFYLVSLNNGEKRRIIHQAWPTYVQLSPREDFVVWFDFDSMSYYSYDIVNDITRNISHSIPEPVYDTDAMKLGRKKEFGTAGWLNQSKESILIYDRYDVWNVDPRAEMRPASLTNQFGKTHQLIFGLFDKDRLSKDGIKPDHGLLYLACYDRKNKHNGFYSINVTQSDDPKLLKMEPYAFYVPTANNYVPRVGITGYVEYASAMEPIKAEKSNKWLVKRMSADEAPNLFFTDDFISFIQISDVQPQKDYNWLTAELFNWKLPSGQVAQGILYKPQNFDSSKKYPIIFTYYEKRSDQLNKFLEPGHSKDRINIPSFVSNGYLVFVPDIYFKQHYNSQSIVDCVVSSANYLSTFSWVDTARMGLQGHSFAGAATNFLIAHTNLFSAACEASGACDAISSYGQLSFGGGVDRQWLVEVNSQGSPLGIGITPWTRPDIYIRNSSIFFLDSVTTPLLMMHGDEDGAVPFEQAIEMFRGLKWAGKKAWLLQYNKADHGLEGKQASDYSTRMQQFFNHYLKSAPAPIWLTQGIPAKLKGVITGYDLDPSGNCGKDCKVCKMWNEKWRSDSVATKQLIEKEEKNQWMGMLDSVKPKQQNKK